MWSLENAFTGAFKTLDPIPQFQATGSFPNTAHNYSFIGDARVPESFSNGSFQQPLKRAVLLYPYSEHYGIRVPGEPNMAKIDEVLKKQQELESLKAEAIKELEQVIADAQAKLEQLTGIGSRPTKKATAQKRAIDPKKPCDICGFATIPNHDARSHRNQDPKKAFTKTELEAKGLVKA